MHHLATQDCLEFSCRLNRLVLAGKVACFTHRHYRIYNHVGDPTSVDERCAFGLVLSGDPLRFVNYPMLRRDDLVSYSDDMDDYHRRVCAALPAYATVQPMHHGVVIHSVCLDDGRLTSTLESLSGPDVVLANRLLGNARWESGLTLCFVISRSRECLHLLYGCRSTGAILTRGALEAVAQEVGASIVKQQRQTRRRIVAQLMCLDECDKIEELYRGMVVHFEGKTYSLETWQHQRVSRLVLPTSAWLSEIVRDAETVESVHRAVESYEGPLDANALAHARLLEALARAKTVLLKAHQNVADDHVVHMLLGRMSSEGGQWIDSDDALLATMKATT